MIISDQASQNLHQIPKTAHNTRLSTQKCNKKFQKFITILKKLSHIITLSPQTPQKELNFIYFPIKSQKIFRNLSLIHHHNLPVAHFSSLMCDNTAGIAWKKFSKKNNEIESLYRCIVEESIPFKYNYDNFFRIIYFNFYYLHTEKDLSFGDVIEFLVINWSSVSFNFRVASSLTQGALSCVHVLSKK